MVDQLAQMRDANPEMSLEEMMQELGIVEPEEQPPRPGGWAGGREEWGAKHAFEKGVWGACICLCWCLVPCKR